MAINHFSEGALRNKSGQLKDRFAVSSSIFDNIQDLISRCDSDGKITYVNSSYAEYFGRSPEHLLGMQILDLVNEPDRNIVAAYFNSLNPAHPTVVFEHQVPTVSGDLCWQKWTITANFDDGGRALEYLSIGEDITLRKTAETELKRTSNFLESVLDAIPDVIGVQDSNHGIIRYNQAGYEFLHLTQEEVRGKKCYQLIGRETPCELCATSEVKRTKRPARIEKYVEEVACWLDVRAYPILDQEGNLVRVIEHLRDINVRKQAEQALRESERRFRSMFENTPGGIVIVGRNYIIKDVNHQTCEMTGYSREELVGKSCALICPHRSLSNECLLWHQHPEGSKSIEAEIVRWDGSRVPILKNVKRVEFEGITYTLENFQDLTESKRLEQERQKISKLESLGTLAGGIAHDFNNLLSAISGHIELAQMETGKDSKIFSDLSESLKGVQRAKNLSQQLLTFSKGGTPVKGTFRIESIIRDTVEFSLRGSRTRAKYNFSWNTRPVNVDKDQITQVIQNLTINAIQAMPQGGILSFSTTDEFLPSHPHLEPGHYVKITIRDQGSGILPEHLPQIFDPYFSTKLEGSGLGLTTSYSIINKHGGSIGVFSKPGKGTTFTIHLPTSRERDLVKEKDAPQYIMGKGQKILVLEDDLMVAKTLKKTLERLGYSPEITHNGREAVGLYRKRKEQGTPFALCLIDLTIPGGMGGNEANRLIHQYDPQAKTIVSSGYANNPVMANYREYGYFAALPKPVTLGKLSQTLADCLRE